MSGGLVMPANATALGARGEAGMAHRSSPLWSEASRSPSFPLIDIFELYYAEIDRIRRRVEGPATAAELAPPDRPFASLAGSHVEDQPPSTPEAGEPRAAAVSRHIANLLQRYGVDLSRSFGSYGATVFEEAQLLMAALADELFIHEIEWPGRAEWRRTTVESQLFGTNNAGNIVFDRLDELLNTGDAAKVELACLYLHALRLDFQGRYRGTGSAEILLRYRKRLFAFIANRDADLANPDRRLFPEAYDATIDLPLARPMPHVARWLVALAGFVAFYLVTSHLIWSSHIEPVRRIIELS
ncbi:MAG: DotU family type IV/VI secretion system protein [Geminicoccaceae bacterium]